MIRRPPRSTLFPTRRSSDLGVRFVMRFNLLGCFLVVAGTALVSGASELLAQPDAFYGRNGYAILLALALLFAWPLATQRAGPAQEGWHSRSLRGLWPPGG